MTAKKHPAKYSPEILSVMTGWLYMEAFWLDKPVSRLRVLDVMAGVGRVHTLPGRTYGIEIEREWAEQHPRTQVGDALALPWRANNFDVIAVSPCYGNRLADHHNAKDASRRRSYRHDLGRPLHPNNAGSLHWGPEYRLFHQAAWREATRVLRPGGLFMLNVSDHIRQKERQPVSAWHCRTLTELGYACFAARDIETPRLRYGENYDARVEAEHLFAFRAPGGGEEMDLTNWYDDHDNLVTLTAWMADNGYSAKDVAYAVEKPHKYEDEFKTATAELEAETSAAP